MFTFTVKPDGADPFQVVATSRDVVRWERANKANSLGNLSDNPRMADLTDLAFFAASRQGLWSGSITEFAAAVDVELEKGEDADGEGEGGEQGSGPTRRGR